AVHRKGAPLQNCWAFIESTAQPICRPSEDQQIYFYARKGVHALKYQALMCPNGLICQLDGPYPGGRHNAGKQAGLQHPLVTSRCALAAQALGPIMLQAYEIPKHS
ncbi:putative nuclease HARBI1 isoform X3, partial [Ixodes scapularis]